MDRGWRLLVVTDAGSQQVNSMRPADASRNLTATHLLVAAFGLAATSAERRYGVGSLPCDRGWLV
jgi:hypothetical protein